MESIMWKDKAIEWLRKYKYAAMVLLLGIVLMAIPTKNRQNTDPIRETQEENAVCEDIELKLETLISEIQGAGKTKVMLTVAKGESVIYQTDASYYQNENSTDSKTETILISGDSKSETGLIHQKNPPVYLGAAILVEGADDPNIRLAVVDAVSKLTGLGADRISVLKMK